MVKKLLLFIILLLIPKISQASVGLGIWPSEINVTISPFQKVSIYLFIFNPSNRSLEVEVKSECVDCSRDILIKGRKVGEVSYYFKMKISPKSLKLERGRNNIYPLILSVGPSFILKRKVMLYPNKISFEVPSLLIGRKSFTIRTSVTSKEGMTRISVTSFVHLSFKGINETHFILFLLSTLVLVIYLVKRFFPLPF